MSDFEPDEYAEPLVKFLGSRYHPELPHIGTIGTADEGEEIMDNKFVKDESGEDEENTEDEQSEETSTGKKDVQKTNDKQPKEFSSFRFVPYSASYEMELREQKSNLLTKFSFYVRTNEGSWDDLDGEDNPSYQKESQGNARDQGFWMTKNDLAKNFRKYDIDIESDVKTGKHGVSLRVNGKVVSTDDPQHLEITNDDTEGHSKTRIVLTDTSDPFMIGPKKDLEIIEQKYEIVLEKTTQVADDGTVKISVNIINKSPFNRVSWIPEIERADDGYETKDDTVKRYKEEVFKYSDQEKEMYSRWRPKLFNKKGSGWRAYGVLYGHLLEFSVTEEGIDSTNRPYESEKQVEFITNLVHNEELQESSDGRVSGKITFMDHIVFDEKIPPMAKGGPLSETSGKIGISDALSKMLEKKFSGGLYNFQADSIKAINSASKKDSDSAVLISSRTGGGKTEAFLIPIIDYCLTHREHPGTKAIIFYPTKALANDQLSRIISMLYEINKAFINEGSPERITVGMSHGDLPKNERHQEAIQKYWDGGVPIKCPKCNDGYLVGLKPKLVRCLTCKEELDFVFLFQEPNFGALVDILITNPDKLIWDMMERPNHHGIFGREISCCNECFAGYGTLLKRKCDCSNTTFEKKKPLPPRFLVFDEIHQFKGTFGTNTLYLHERLKAMFKRYAMKNFEKDWSVCSIGSSATVADAERFAKTFFSLDESQISIVPKDDDTKESYYEKAEGNKRRHIFLMPYRYRPAATCSKVVGYLQARRMVGAKPEPFSEMYGKVGDPLQILGFVNNLSDVGTLRLSVARERQDLMFESDGHSTDYGQGDRGRAEREFNKKELNVIFATPTLEVGVDFDTINSILIYGFPFSFNQYVQRIGRGGRGENSLVVTISHRWRPIDHYYMADARRKLSEQQKAIEPIPITRDNPNLIQKHLIGAFWDYISSLEDAPKLFNDMKREMEPTVAAIGDSMFDISKEHSPINSLGLTDSEKTEHQPWFKNYIETEKRRMAAYVQQITPYDFLHEKVDSPGKQHKAWSLRQIENNVEVELIWEVS